MAENYNRFDLHQKAQNRELVACPRASMDDNLHSLPRRLIELRIEHADLDNLIDRATLDARSFGTADRDWLLAQDLIPPDAEPAWRKVPQEALTAVAGSTAIYTSADEPGLIYDTITVSPQRLAQRRADCMPRLCRIFWQSTVYRRSG